MNDLAEHMRKAHELADWIEANYCTVREAAKIRGVSVQTIYSAIRSGRLATRIIVGETAIKREELAALTLRKRGEA